MFFGNFYENGYLLQTKICGKLLLYLTNKEA